MKLVRRAYKYRFYPTDEQKIQLAHTFGCARFVYNYFLKVRSDAYKEKKDNVNFFKMCILLTQLKKKEEFSWLRNVANVTLQQSLRDLDQAFKNFFKKRSLYPNFKKKNVIQSVRYTNAAFSFCNGLLKIAKSKEPLRIRWSRKFTGKPSSVTVSKDCADRYFVSILVEEEVFSLPKLNKTIGIDVGIKDICVTSDGFKSGAPKNTRKYEKILARRQQDLSRKVKGSKNRIKARLAVARIHAKISDSRNDFNHKLTTKLIRENQAIAVESLNVKGMLKNHCLAKSISDSSWGEIFRQLKYKAEWYGRDIFEINQWFPSSKTCNCCGYINKELKISDRIWQCPSCKESLDRDVNAAKNILTVRQTGLAFGENVRLAT